MRICYTNLGNQGRLGNHLWQIAGTLGLAETHGAEVDFNHWDYESYFNVPPAYFVDDPWGTEASNLVLHLPKSERVYLQDYNLWANIRDAIHGDFQPSERSRAQLEEFAWFRKYPNKVAVHIRRDERVSRYQHSHPTPPAAYYQRAMDIERERLGDPLFCIFSDDIAWCKDHLTDGEFVFVNGYPRHQDIYGAADEAPIRDHLDIFLMAECVGHIIANSTFSWWGAFLSENPQPIYPAVWYGETLKHVPWRLQMPPDWREVCW